MNILFKIFTFVLLLLTVACNENANPIKTADKELLKTQTEALEKAKQAEQMLMDGAQQQHENINTQTQ